jgi:hypothetical protein
MHRLQKIPELKPIAFLAEVARAMRAEAAGIVNEGLPARIQQLCRRLEQAEAKEKPAP